MRCDTIVHYCFDIWLGVADAHREFSEHCQPGTSSRDSFTRIPIAAIFSVNNFMSLPIHSWFVLVHLVCGCSQHVFSSPKQEEGIGRATVSRFTIFPRRLSVCPLPVCAMVYYIISREVTERDAAWSFSRDLTIRPDRTDIWCASLHTCVFGSFWFFATGFLGKGEKGKVPRRSQETHLFIEILFEEEAAHSIRI